MSALLETAGRIVAKCDQTLVWATKFFPKDRPENEFGRPNLGRGYRMFSAYLRSISEINIFKTDQRTWGNNIIFLPKEAAIILTGSLRFSATCCLILFSRKTLSRTRLLLYRRVSECTEMKRNGMKWVALSTLQLKVVGTQIDRSIILSSEWVIKWVSEWMDGCGWVMWLIDPMSEWMSAWEWVDVGWWESEWMWLIDWVSEWVDVGEWVSGCDWLIDWSIILSSEWVGGCGWVSEWMWLIDPMSEWVDECLRVSRCGLVNERVSGCDWLIEWVSEYTVDWFSHSGLCEWVSYC